MKGTVHVAYTDSVDKVVSTYFACVTNIPFEYKGVTYEPQALRVSPMLLRDFTCPPMCGGCCPRFSLDFLPGEDRPNVAKEREVFFDGKGLKLFSDMQDDHTSIKCRNLNWDDGRCGIYTHRPFSCDFELIRFLVSGDPSKRKNQMTQKLFGRGWNMLRVDKERGALCEMTPITKHSISEVVRKLTRLKQWTDYFGVVDTKVPKVLEWVQFQTDYENIKPLFLTKTGDITNG